MVAWSPSTGFLKITLSWSVCSVLALFLLFTLCFGFVLLFLNCSTVVASWALFAFSSASYRLLVCSGTRVTARPDRDGGGEGFLQILFPRLLLCTTTQRKRLQHYNRETRRIATNSIFSAQHRRTICTAKQKKQFTQQSTTKLCFGRIWAVWSGSRQVWRVTGFCLFLHCWQYF